MIVRNLQVTVGDSKDGMTEMRTDQGAAVTISSHLVNELKKGDVVYVAFDKKPLVAADQHAKDVLNEIIGNSGA